MEHNFHKSLKSEQAWQSFADEFYVKAFNVKNIIRYNKNTPHDLDIQRKDIDLSLVRFGRCVSVSEKFRAKDFDDLYLEVYSKYPKVLGWMNNSEADFLAYFFKTRMFLIDKKKLIDFYRNKILIELPDKVFYKFNLKNLNKNAQDSLYITISGRKYKIKLIQAFNNTDNTSWHTIGIAIPFVLLEHGGVYCRQFLFGDYKNFLNSPPSF